MRNLQWIPLLVLGLNFLSCENKRQYIFDFEEAPVIILGKENCRSNDAENAWIINLTPYRNKSFGVPLNFKGKEFRNVVKVYNYNFQREFADSAFKHFADFYVENVSGSPCEIPDPVVYQVPTIKIKAVVRTQ